MAKVMDCGLKVSEFELQLCYYILFRTIILEKGMNPATGITVSLLFFYKDDFGTK